MYDDRLTIGRLAARAQVNVETVRYYQRRGLLPMPDRPLGGIRHYGAMEVSRLQFIRRAQAVGFSLSDIGNLLQLKGRHACERTRQLTAEKLAEVRNRMVELQHLETELAELVRQCEGSKSENCCPTLDHLDRPTQ
jgi:MerR family mercuric resistance operon transcriptional regulator